MAKGCLKKNKALSNKLDDTINTNKIKSISNNTVSKKKKGLLIDTKSDSSSSADNIKIKKFQLKFNQLETSSDSSSNSESEYEDNSHSKDEKDRSSNETSKVQDFKVIKSNVSKKDPKSQKKKKSDEEFDELLAEFTVNKKIDNLNTQTTIPLNECNDNLKKVVLSDTINQLSNEVDISNKSLDQFNEAFVDMTSKTQSIKPDNSNGIHSNIHKETINSTETIKSTDQHVNVNNESESYNEHNGNQLKDDDKEDELKNPVKESNDHNEKPEVLTKNMKKKLKKKEKAAAAATEESGTTVKNKSKPLSAAARLAQQRLLLLKQEKEREEEEERKQKELDLIREKQEQEEQRIKEEKKLHMKKLKQEQKERLKKEGKLLTQAAKEKLRKAQISREQFCKQMNIDNATFIDNQTTGSKHSKAVKSLKKNKHVYINKWNNDDIPVDESVEILDDQTDDKDEEEQKKPESIPITNSKESTEFNFLDYLNTITESKENISEDHEEIKSDVGQSILDTENIKSDSIPVINSSKLENVIDKTLTKSLEKINKRSCQAEKDKSQLTHLRSPICCILGHVDTGKTKLLDKIRKTDIQADEAGGITQQIGATFFPKDALWEQCKKVDMDFLMEVPGLLIVDTPGHESFNNLRARGSSLCDIAILVVDIMHGLEPQTRESLELLRSRKCPFIVALNKIDRLYDWNTTPWVSAQKTLELQKEHVRDEFEKRSQSVLLQLTEQGLNCALWWEIEDPRYTVSVAPTSAITGEGIPDLLFLLVKLTQTIITKALVFQSQFQCTILEVKAVEGLGTTIDVILISGTIHDNDKIVICGFNGPIVTTIRALLTPQPLRELRVKADYIHHKQIDAAMGVKISAPGLEDSVAGTSLLLATNKTDQDIEILKDDVMSDITNVFKCVDRSGIGVYVMASTLGSLEALLEFLSRSKIPVFAVNIGTVNKLDVKKASVMREKNRPDLCCILAFDVKVDTEAFKEAQSLGVTIYHADIIYHLFDKFTKHLADYQESIKREKKSLVVFPCILSIIPNFIFNKKDPIVLGVKVEEGFIRVGTPLCVPDKDKLNIGRVSSLEHNKKTVEQAKKGDEVALKINGDPNIVVGRHFDASNKLYSRLSRDSIDCLKAYFRDELTKDDWKTVIEIKKVLGIV